MSSTSTPVTSTRKRLSRNANVSPSRTSPRRTNQNGTSALSITLGKSPSAVLRRNKLIACFNANKNKKAQLTADKVKAEEKIDELNEAYRVHALEIIAGEPEAEDIDTVQAALIAVQQVLTRLRAERAQINKDNASVLRRAAKAEKEAGRLKEQVTKLTNELEELKEEQVLDRTAMDALLARMEE